MRTLRNPDTMLGTKIHVNHITSMRLFTSMTTILSTFRGFLEASSQTAPHVKQMEYTAKRLHSTEHLPICQIKGIPT